MSVGASGEEVEVFGGWIDVDVLRYNLHSPY